MAKFETHTFWCIRCGQQTIPIMRKAGFMHGKFHRKKLYCLHCKAEINCIECRNDNEVWEFKRNFEEGVYKDEAEESLSHCRDSGSGQVNMGA